MKLSVHARLAVPLLIGMIISIALLVLSELSHRRLTAANQALAISMETQAMAAEVLVLVTDAEDGGSRLPARRAAQLPGALSGGTAADWYQTGCAH